MSDEPMPNPYEDWEEPESFRIGRRALWAVVAAFILVCLLPPLYRNVYEAVKRPTGSDPRWVPVVELFRKGDQPVTAHLKAYEDRLDKAEFRDGPRRLVQKALTSTLREGNTKTVIGKDGWLFFRPALDGLTGYGPLAPEPDSVAKDPNRPPWSGPKDAIETFARQLDGFGVELILVPIPVKPMIYPEFIAGDRFDGPVRHRDAEAFYAELARQPNVTVVDLADEFWAMKADTPVFLRQDTHWTPGAMEAAAKRIAATLRERPWFAELGADPARFVPGEPEIRASIGDLVEKLDVLPVGDPNVPQAGFDLEEARVRPVLDNATAMAPVGDPESPVVLLGDSFTNIYSRAGDLNWGEGAGLGEHLARELGLPVDVIAINGQAATGVRERLAERRGSALAMRRKKAVVWAVAARDLFLSETVASRNDVRWENVTFNDKPEAEPGPADEAEATWTVEATMTLKSEIPDPATVPYKDALYGAEYRVDKVIEGEGIAGGDTLVVAHWAFENKLPKASAGYAVGSRRTLTLVPFASRGDLQTMQIANDADPTILELYWGEERADAEAPAGEVSNRPARLIAGGVCGFVSLLVIGLIARAARREGRA